MHKGILMMLLAVVSNSAMAEWVRLSNTDEDGNNPYILYVDPATVRRSGSMVKLWELRDYKKAQVSITGKPQLSAKVQREYDCEQERQRLLYIVEISGAMGSGNIVGTLSDIAKWKPISPESIGEIAWQFACKKQ